MPEPFITPDPSAMAWARLVDTLDAMFPEGLSLGPAALDHLDELHVNWNEFQEAIRVEVDAEILEELLGPCMALEEEYGA
jgi:hypothetical protein